MTVSQGNEAEYIHRRKYGTLRQGYNYPHGLFDIVSRMPLCRYKERYNNNSHFCDISKLHYVILGQ